MYLVGTRSPSSLGFYRPNQAMNRQIYSGRVPLAGLGRAARRPRLHGLGDGVTFDPTLMLGGIGVLALAMFLLGGRAVPKIRARRRRSLERKRARLSERIAALGPA